MRDEGTIGAFLTGFTQVHVRKDKESKPLMSSVIYKSMYLGFWRDVSMSIRLIPTNSIRVILAYWLKCTCWCQSRVWGRRIGLPPCAHDGTERRIVRPQDPVEQKASYSGKKRDHTVKNVLLVNALLVILFLSDTHGGRVHDKPIADATPYPLPVGSRLLQDLGFLAFTLPGVVILMPTKKPRGQELTREQQRTNQALHQRRLRIEHVNSSVKRCRIVKDRIRLWKQGIRDLVMELCWALHNFRVRLNPWLPMI